MLILNALSGFGVGGVPEWITLTSADWQGNTANFTLGDGTATANSTDRNIRTNDTLIASGQDFDFEVIYPASTANAVVGFCTSGTSINVQSPTTTNPIVYAKDSPAAGTTGWLNNNDSVDASKSSGWTQSNTIKISRRGSTFYGSINGVLDETYSGTTGSGAGKLFVGCAGVASGWTLTGLRYRAGSGLPAIS